MSNMSAFGQIYRGRRVLITGHTGFKGSWLALWLKELGAEICGYALPPCYSGSHFERLGLANELRHEEADLRDAAHLNRVFADFQPEIVFHLAAQALVRASYKDPVETFSTNIGGGTLLLDAVRQTPSVNALVFITSDKCYLNKEWVWGYRETDELGGPDPYSASKGAAELVFRSYWESFFRERAGFSAATTRAGNVIGGGDLSEDRLIPDCIRALLDNREIVLRYPAATRPWQFVLEPVSGYLQLGAALLKTRETEQRDRFCGAWNFGPAENEVRTVKSVTETVISHWGNGQLRIEQAEGDKPEAGLLKLSIDKATQILGWQPRYEAEKALEETTNWYRRVLVDGEDAASVSRQQLHGYMTSMDHDA